MSQEERDRLKEEYKEHYRKIRDVKEKVRRSQAVRNISEAVQQMNSDELLESVDHFLGEVRQKVARFEARLDVAMENLSESESIGEYERDETVRKERARETIRQVKSEMGMLYNELEEKAGQLHVEKTVGRSEKENSGELGSKQKTTK
ncbi:MAG: hypothetical protein WD355_04925 [Balneolaceae bacterium]